MGKSLYIAEKPSVAQEFAKALNIFAKRKDGPTDPRRSFFLICRKFPEEKYG